MPMSAAVVPHDPRWLRFFHEESKMIGKALGSNVVAIHHIGSTPIQGLYAKPIIDMLVEVADIDDVDFRNPAMKTLGYEAMGEFGLPGRRYFRKDADSGERTHHVHAFQQGCPEVGRHLLFRDFLTAYPEWAAKYSELKRHLVEAHPQDSEAYKDGKDAFIRDVDRRAKAWHAARSTK